MLTYIVSGTAVFIGAIQDVAPILTNFFLLTYHLTLLPLAWGTIPWGTITLNCSELYFLGEI